MAFENLKKTGIKYVLTKLKDYFLQIKDAVKTVNQIEPDEDGDIQIDTVPYAQNLETELAQRTVGSYIARTAGGAASIEDGGAWLMSVKGNSIHEGYVEESLEMTVTPADPDAENAITATIVEATFITACSGVSGTYTFSYSTDHWDTDPSTYGITVTGTPADGDQIVVVYVAEERGTIYVANPNGLIATGWNLFDYANGYARVLKYSDDPAECFGISGTYTALKFSETLDGAQTSITVTDGKFSVPSDGYVWVTGGNGTNTAIWMTWDDWTEEYEGDFEAYTTSEDDFSNEMATYFPNGLLKAGTAVDEININIGKAISRVERLAYSAANRAVAVASGRQFEFDTDYIFLERETAVTNDISVDGSITVNDHGLELITQTDIPVEVEMLYGANLKNKLERNVLTMSQQSLTWTQKGQIWKNLGFEKFKFASDATSKTWAEFVSSVASFATDSMVFYTVGTAIGTQLLGASQSIIGFCLIQKGSSSNAYYMFSNRNGMAVGNIAMSNGAVTIYWSSVNTKVTDTATSFSDVNTTSGTNTRLGSITFAPGSYVIIATAYWASNATGYRELSFCDSEGTQLNLAAKTIVAAVDGAVTRQQTTITYKPTSQTTIYLYGRQNSGSTLACSSRYAIARIG